MRVISLPKLSVFACRSLNATAALTWPLADSAFRAAPETPNLTRFRLQTHLSFPLGLPAIFLKGPLKHILAHTELRACSLLANADVIPPAGRPGPGAPQLCPNSRANNLAGTAHASAHTSLNTRVWCRRKGKSFPTDLSGPGWCGLEDASLHV